MADNTEQRWQGHPVLARAVRVAIFVVPFVTAMVVAFFLSTQLPIAESTTMRVLRWLGIVVISTAAMTVIDRLARKLLPLSALLKLTLLFPDQAPSRFRIAMRTGTTNQLRKRMDAARTVGKDETPSQAAERLLELVGLLSHHDRLTRGHSERVRAYTHLIGEEMGLTDVELDKVRWAGLLHDVGKTAISTDILNKPGRLTDDEFDVIKTHPMEGRALVEPLAAWLGDSLRAVWEHHERFDGRGYPQGLSGTDISIAARIVSVADSYDVMTSARSYKKPMSAGAARAELATCSGTQFDPIVVRSFLNVSLGRLRLMNGPLAWFAQLALFEPSGVVHAGEAVASGGSTSGASAAASTVAGSGASGLASTAAAVTVSVAASTAGMAAASPPEHEQVEFAEAVVVTTVEAAESLPTPDEAVFDLGSGRFELPEAVVPSSSIPATDDDATAPRLDSALPTTVAASTTVPPTTTVAPTTTATAPATTAPSVVAPPIVTSAPTTQVPASPTTAPARTTAASTTTTTTIADRPTTTTTIPETTTTTTTTTIPETTTTTTVPETTTTTTTTTIPGVSGDAGRVYLGGDVLVDTPALAYHLLTEGDLPDIDLPNYDTDRDAFPGSLVQKDAAGIEGTDSTKVLKFTASTLSAREVDGNVHLDLYFAAKDFNRNDIDVEAGLYHCPLVGDCVLLGSDAWRYRNADQFRKVKFHFNDIEATVAFGDRIEVRVAVLDSSEDDAWFAFGTEDFPSHLKFTGDD